MRKHSAGICSFFVTLLWSAAVLATTQTGQILATVRDVDNKPLADVTLKIKSPDLQGARELKTSADGQVRFKDLPPGVYEVTAIRDQYANGKVEKVSVNIGRTSSVELFLVPLSSENVEEVVVTGAVSTVDTERVSLGSSVGEQFLSDVPTDRQYQSVVALAPGVIGSGNPNVGGATMYANQYLLDGVDITDPVTHTFSTNFNFDQMKEVEVITGGRDAEYGGAPGAVVNIVTKSGSNEHKIDASFYYSGNKVLPLQLRRCDWPGHCTAYRKALDDKQKVAKTWDVTGNVNVEGPVIKDQLWYSVSLEVPWTGREPVVPDTGNPFPGVSHPARTYVGVNGFGKLTWQPNESHNIKLLLQGDPAKLDNTSNSYFVHPDAEEQQKQGGFIVSLTDDFFVNDDIVWTNRVAYKQLSLDIGPESGNLDLAGRSNKDTGLSTINDGTDYEDSRTRVQFQSIASYSLKDLMGEHQFKAGFEAAYYGHREYQSTPGGAYYTDATNPSEQSVQRLVEKQDTRTWADMEGIFLQDMWKPISSLTIRPGVRFDSARLRSYDGVTQVAINTFLPRVGASWDPLGDGKTAIRAGYYQYVDTGSLMLSDFAGGKSPRTRTYNYNPVTGQYDNFQYESGGESAAVAKDYLKKAWNQQRPRAHEFIVGSSRELMRNLKVSADFTYRRLGNQWEDTETNVIWDQTGTKVLGFKDGKPHYIWSLGALKEAFIRYMALQFVVEKKFSDNFEVMASYVYSRTQGTEPGAIGNAFDRPFMRQYEYGNLPSDLRHVLKVDAAYHFPFGITLGGDGSYSSGGPYNHFFFNSFYQDYGDRRSPLGQDVDGTELRMHWSYILNMRVTWSAKEFIDQDIEVVAQANNLTNRAYPVGISQADYSTAPFGTITDRMNPTTFMVGLRYRY